MCPYPTTHTPLDGDVQVRNVAQDEVDEPLQPILPKVVLNALRVAVQQLLSNGKIALTFSNSPVDVFHISRNRQLIHNVQ